MKQEIIRCIVAARNAGGEPDLFFVKIKATREEIENGDHYDAAMNAAEEDGYEPTLAYDEKDYGGKMMLKLFDWKTANIISV